MVVDVSCVDRDEDVALANPGSIGFRTRDPTRHDDAIALPGCVQIRIGAALAERMGDLVAERLRDSELLDRVATLLSFMRCVNVTDETHEFGSVGLAQAYLGQRTGVETAKTADDDFTRNRRGASFLARRRK